jgi:hypothetical protein
MIVKNAALLNYCPSTTKVGQNWYQPTCTALVLGHWIFFCNFKGPASWILPKDFGATRAQTVDNVGKNW